MPLRTAVRSRAQGQLSCAEAETLEPAGLDERQRLQRLDRRAREEGLPRIAQKVRQPRVRIHHGDRCCVHGFDAVSPVDSSRRGKDLRSALVACHAAGYCRYVTLRGKTLFITGASRGIGKAIALRAARDGASI